MVGSRILKQGLRKPCTIVLLPVPHEYTQS
jgi:hypothetical protein